MVQDAMSIIRDNSFLKIDEVLELFPDTNAQVNQMNDYEKDKVKAMQDHLVACLDDYYDKLKIMRTQIEVNAK